MRFSFPKIDPSVNRVEEHIVVSMALRKSWCWVGAFGPSAMVCVARAKVGPLGRTWWAVWDGERLHEGTRGVSVSPTSATVRDGDTRLDLALAHGRPIEVATGPAWTRKTPLGVTGTIALGGTSMAIDSAGLLDESAGRHARRTAWRWSAGAGVAESGAAVTWNLVEGLHDGDLSERTVWLDGEPHALPHQPFDGLDAVGELRFTAEAVRAKRENYLVVASDYEQPFGTFAGALPIAGALRGWGVMERHTALW
jgi:hypothetical protein